MTALLRDLDHAPDWATWHAIAQAMDADTGRVAWRHRDDLPGLDVPALRDDIRAMERLEADADAQGLEDRLIESLSRHHDDVTAPWLFQQTRTGEPPQVVLDYLDACERALHWLATAEISGLPPAARRQRFLRARQNFGRPALLLSGGGAWGLYHLGVVRALFQHGLLPEVVCGSSMGAIVAAGVCTRTDDELATMLDHPERIHRTAVRLLGPRGWRQHGAALDPEQLREHVFENVGMATFEEARAHSGRTLNVSISPTRTRQKPRVLSHRTAGRVLVGDAVVASCSIPVLFPPVALRARDPAGDLVPWLPGERWVDGSMQGDLPMQRLARLHNVNQFIVSQANPFVVPFMAGEGAGWGRRALQTTASLLRGQGAALLDGLRRQVRHDRIRPLLDSAHGLSGQPYGGDITIHPRVPPSRFLSVMANPSLSDLEGYLRGGEQAAWPRLPLVREHTRIARLLHRYASTPTSD
jgi:NTE family protein